VEGFRLEYELPTNSYTRVARANTEVSQAFGIRLGQFPMSSDPVTVRLCAVPGAPVSLSGLVCRTMTFDQFSWGQFQRIDLDTLQVEGRFDLFRDSANLDAK
jgi:hypothetical protein